MATYTELLQAKENQALNQKILVACFVAAEAIRKEPIATDNHPNRLIWAKAVFSNPQQEAQRMVWAVLAQNKDFSLSAITGATDAQVQTAVNDAVDVFATGA